MVWVKLDDHFPDHPKVVSVGPLAAWLHVCGIAYCNRHLTDGLIPRTVAHRLADFGDFNENCAGFVARLVDIGLWKETRNGDYRIHDYHDYQPSKRMVEAEREKARERMKRLRSGRSSGELRENFGRSSGTPVPVPRSKSKTLVADATSDSGGREITTPPRDAGSRSPRKPDPLWDALVEIFGAEAAGVERGRWNKACQSLRQSGATPDTVRAAAVSYQREWPSMTMTPMALAANWTVLAANGTGPKRTGWRIVRGSHGTTHVRDPEGTDRPPRD